MYTKAQRRAYDRARRAKDPEAAKARDAKYYTANRGVILERSRTVYKAKRQAAVRRWQAANPDKLASYRKSDARKLTVKVNAGKRRAAKGVGSLTRAEWLSVCDVFGNCCAYCLEPLASPSLDHFRPVSKDGEHTVDNVVPACKSCNFKKNASLVFDFLPRGVGVTVPQVGL